MSVQPPVPTEKESRKNYAEAQFNQKFFKEALEACLAGNVDALDLLINEYTEKRRDVSIEEILNNFQSEGRTFIHVACSSGKKPVVDYIFEKSHPTREMINKQDKMGATPLILATISESLEIMKMLIDSGASVDLCNSDGAAALHFAAGDGSLPRMQLLCDANASLSLNSRSGNVLHWAAGKGHSAAIRFLLTKGVEYNALSSDGLPAVVLAAVANSDDGVTALIEAGADCGHLLTGNLSVLHICAENGLHVAVNALIRTETGRRLCSVETSDGNTPIHLAAMSEHREIIKTLLSYSQSAVDSINCADREDTEKLIDAVIKDGAKRLATWNENAQAAQNAKEQGSTTFIDGRVLEATTLPASTEDIQLSEDFKAKGNDYFKQKNYTAAMEAYNQSIQLNGANAFAWSNRSACFIALGDPQNALRDAEVCRRLDANWSKGCYRLAVARLKLGLYEDAAVAAFEGCKLDESNEELKKTLQLAVKLGQEDHKKKQGK